MASCPSPLRYAGGEAWFAPRVADWCRDVGARTLVDSFAGGASTAIQCLLSGAVGRAVLSEADPGVRSLWQVVLEGAQHEYWAFRSAVMRVQPSRASVGAFLAEQDGTRAALATRILVRNRASFGGSLEARMLREDHLRARWSTHEWAARMRLLRLHRDAFTVHGPCALTCLAAHADGRTAFLFLDPPYSAWEDAAGHGLYRHAALDHDEMLAAACASRGALVCTYDASPTTRALAARHGLYAEGLPMRDGRGRLRQELLLARNAC